MADQPLLNTYGRLPVAIERGEGIWLYDIKGDRYLDTFTGVGVCGLGHAHPAVSEALASQAQDLTHCSNLFHSPVQHALAKKLCEISGMDGAFLANSGAEANEAAIKLARHYGHQRGIANPTIIVMERAYHGRTMATLTASGNRKLQAGVEPLLNGFTRAPFNDFEAVLNIAASNHSVVAVLAETIQGEGGVRLADGSYLRKLSELCQKQGWLLMLDEIQSGNGRTGRYCAYEHHGVVPDVVTLAGGLGNGFPIGACLARGAAAKVFKPGNHGSTFGGNPLACAVAQAVLSTLENMHLMARARALGNRVIERLRDYLEGADYIREIRGKGLMIGIEMQDSCPELVLLAKAQGLLINITDERVIRLLPALTMTDQEADDMTDRIIRIIKLYAADERERPRR